MPANNEPGERVPLVLSGQLAALVANPALRYDISLEGVPFLVKPSQQDPYLRQITEGEKEQFDSSREAGENSFGRWWLRSQATWHGGAGQRYMDSSEEALRSRFDSSNNVQVHTPGELTVSPTASGVSGTWAGMLQVTRSAVPWLVTMYTNSNKVRLWQTPALTTVVDVTLGAAGTPQAMTTDGVNIWVAINDSIYRIDSTNAATLIYNSGIPFSGGAVTMGFAKQRLILCIGPKVWQLDPNPAGAPVAAGAAHYTNPSTSYSYTAVAEGPNGIYLVGYSGPNSDVASMSVTESAGSVVLGPPVVQLRLPTGETAWSLLFYIGSLFALGTSEGVRVGGFTPYGQPELGRLLMDGFPVRALGASGTLVYAGSTDSAWTVDLATPLDQQGGYAYSRFAVGLGATGTDHLTGLTVVPGTTDLAYGTTSTGRLVSQGTAVTTAGVLTTSWLRFDTTEPKALHYITVDGDFPAPGGSAAPCVVVVESNTGDTRTFTVPAGSTGQTEFGLSGQMSAAQAYRLTITLRGQQTVLRSWQLKARPMPRRHAEVVLPLIVADTITPSGGETRGYAGLARDQLSAVEQLAAASATITVVDKLLDISYQAEVARFQFRQDLAPAHNNNLAGVLNVVLRLV